MFRQLMALSFCSLLGTGALASDQFEHAISLLHPGAWVVSIPQEGRDLVCRLSVNDGVVVVSDSPSHEIGPEIFVVDTEGAVDLVVRCATRVAEMHPGKANFSAVHVRAYALAEGARLSGFRQLHAGGAASASANNDAQASQSYRRAAELFAADGDVHWEAIALIRSGAANYLAGDKLQAARDFRLARSRASVQSADLAAWSSGFLGKVLFDLSDPAGAKSAYTESVSILEPMGETRGLAEAINALALFHHQRGELNQAQSGYLRAQVMFGHLGLEQNQAILLNNLGGIAYDRAEPDEAARRFSAALDIHKRLGDREGEADVLGNMAALKHLSGDPDAVRDEVKVLELRKFLDDDVGVARSKQRLGKYFLDFGDVERARVYLLQAADEQLELEEIRSRNRTLMYLAKAERLSGHERNANLTASRALAAARSIADPLLLADSLVLGLEFDPKASAASAGEIGAALQLYQDRGLRYKLARGLLVYGRWLFENGQPLESRPVLSESQRLFSDFRDRIGSAEALIALADVAVVLEEDDQAIGFLADALAAVVVDAESKLFPLLHARVSKVFRELRERNLALGMRANAEGENLLAERQLAVYRSNRVGLIASVPAQGSSRLGDAKMLLGTSRRTGQPPSDMAVQDVLGELAQLELQHRQLQANASFLSEAGHEPYLVYEVLGDLTLAWFVSGSTVEMFQLPSREEMRSAAESALRSHDYGDIAAMLLQPLEGKVLPKNSVIHIVPDEFLANMPFAAFPYGGDVLTERFAISYSSGWSNPSGDPGLGKKALIVGSSGSQSANGRLAFSGPEIEQISAALETWTTRTLRDTEATHRAVVEALPDFDVLHFSSHGVVNNRFPELSGLELFSDRNGEMSLLTAWEIDQQPIHANLVVLAACRSAISSPGFGEGVKGLTNAFLRAGARNVLGTLWEIPDNSAAAFMAHFYAEIAQTDSPMDRSLLRSAVQRTQIWMRAQRRFRDPVHWAGYVLH